SIFLEQVSLANYSTVVVIFLAAMWTRLSLVARLFYVALVVLILISNNSRTGLGLAVAAPLVCWLAPKVKRFNPVLVMPAILVIARAITVSVPPTKEDNFIGRIGTTIRSLADLDFASAAGAQATRAPDFADSGYTYLIFASSVVGLLCLWLFVSFALRRDDER